MSDEIASVLERIRLYWDRTEDMFNDGTSGATDDSPVVLEMLPGVRLGIDNLRRYHLLLSLSEGEESVQRRLTAGISILTQDYQIDDVSSLWIDIVAQRRWRFAMEPFAAELVMKMKDSTIDLQTLNTLVDEYRALWRRPREPMDTRIQRGLIGEMLVVERLDSVIGLAAAIDRWQGPFDELHDIIDDEWHIEVKSYADEPPRVRISQVEQLDARIDAKLTLVGVHIMGTATGNTLPDFIDAFVKVADDKGVKSLALERLSAAGWDEEYRDEYSSRFVTGRTLLCPIHIATPVFPAKLLGELPHSVDKVTYRLALNDLFQLNGKYESSWELACSAGDWLDTDLEFTVRDQFGSDSDPRFNLLVETERTYRELIYRAYIGKFGNQWWQNVPGKVRGNVQKKIEQWRKEGEQNLDTPSRRYWDAATTGDLFYAMTVKGKWPTVFEEIMDISRGNFQKHWEFFSKLRNTTFHSNEPLTEAHLEEGLGATKIVRAIASTALKKLESD